MRKPIIAGNWKMHTNTAEATVLVEALKTALQQEKITCEVVVCPPFTNLSVVGDLVEGSGIAVGAQNMHYEEKGAFTGEISPLMLNDLGCKYVILGHSERRQYFGEDNQLINQKIKAAFTHDIVPILCVGESLEQRDEDKTFTFIGAQLTEGLQQISDEEVATMVIAYEPIWAIGTGKTATAEQAGEVCTFIRQKISELYNQDVADKVRIQYGGSVKGSNAAEILAQTDIDGALVGGASLKACDFFPILKSV